MRIKLMVLALLLTTFAAYAQTPKEVEASFNAHKNEFDYLLGDWAITLHNTRGTIHGFWSTERLEAGQVFDEYRLVNDKGETVYLTTTIRAYNPVLNRWELISMDPVNGLQNFGTGHFENGEMHIEQRFGQGPDHGILRIRYHDIKPDSFLWNADRSTDDGKTWAKDALRIEAKRIGPARTMTPLTSPKQ